jgi:starch synthase
MYIIHIASEIAPVAKVGGLGDVLQGLARELSWKGHDVDVFVPKYDCIDSDGVRDLTVAYQDLISYYEGNYYHNTIWTGWVENIKVYFIEPHHPRYFFNRGCFYGCDDDIERYLYFSRCALEYIYKKPLHPDIIHLHDWQTAVIAPLYHDVYLPMGMAPTKIVFTIHNFEYQGRCAVDDLDKIGMKGATYLNRAKLQDNLYSSSINLLKGGIVYSDFVTTVSPNYANEVKAPDGGRSLDTTLVNYQQKFRGVLNGLDYSYWNPETDRHLPTHYSSREIPLDKHDRNVIDKKAYLKKLLREELSLDESHAPLVGCIARLVPQKGPELIKHAIKRTLAKGGQFVLLGQSPIPEINAEFHNLKQEYSTNPNVALVLHHQEDLAHMIYGASDMFIVPSLFEPCGLTQLIALRYGSVPIVRRTGGLADTIFDIDHSGPKEANGYLFTDPTPEGVDSALDRAIALWFHDPEKWRKLMVHGMNMDYSWNKPSNQYLEIYGQLLKK